MNKFPNPNRKKSNYDLPGIAYILAFLLGVILFWLFGESLFGIKPEPVWIAGLMGLSVSLIVVWGWCKIHNKNKDDGEND